MRARLSVAAIAALAIAGCSSSSSGGDTTPPPTTPVTTASASTTSSPTQSPSPTPTPTFSTTVKASHRCGTSDLSMTVGQGQGAAGSTIIPLVFTNTSHKPCTLYGYPGVSFLDSGESQIGQAAARSGTEEGVVTLAPNGAGVANAQLKIPDPGNFSPSDCNQAKAAFVRAYPPDETHFIETEINVPICTTAAGVAMVSPITPGSGG